MKLLTGLSLGLLIAICGHAREIAKDYDPLAGIAKLDHFPDDAEIRRRVRSARSIVVLEGLPHYLFEPTALRREAMRPDVVWTHDLGFYEKPLQIQESDLMAICSILSDEIAFEPRGAAPKLCGGFHPDYCVTSQTEGTFVHAMICLGCAEVVFLTNEGYSYLDVRREAHSKLKALLEKYRANRPIPRPEQDEEVVPPPTLPKHPEAKTNP